MQVGEGSRPKCSLKRPGKVWAIISHMMNALCIDSARIVRLSITNEDDACFPIYF